MSDHLFDPAPLTKGVPREERAARKKSAQPLPVLTVPSSERWVLLANGHGAHYRDGFDNRGAVSARCGVVGTQLALEPGTTLAACPACIEKGAPT